MAPERQVSPVWGVRRLRPRGYAIVAIVLATVVVLLAVGAYAYAVVNRPWAGLAFDRGGATRKILAIPTVAPRPSTPSNRQQNARMGCAFGPPAPLSPVIYRGVAAGHPAPDEVALTFDDGPVAGSTIPILDYLEQTRTPATFFVVGQEVQAAPELVRREWRDGDAIGVHTWTHPDMTRLGRPAQHFQFASTLDALHTALGRDACIWFWRPPYGAYNAQTIEMARAFGLTTILWNDDPRDWSRPGTDAIVSTALREAYPGGIIILHDGPALREQTLAALPTILAGLRARGLWPVTLPRLLMDGGYRGIATTPTSPWHRTSLVTAAPAAAAPFAECRRCDSS